MTKYGILSKGIIFYLVIMGLLIISPASASKSCTSDGECDPCETCDFDPDAKGWCTYHEYVCPPDVIVDEGYDNEEEGGSDCDREKILAIIGSISLLMDKIDNIGESNLPIKIRNLEERSLEAQIAKLQALLVIECAACEEEEGEEE